MSLGKKEKTAIKRNYDKEAEFQIKILEQKTREDYLTLFSQCDDDSTPIYGSTTTAADQIKRRSDSTSDTKTCIPVNAKAILEKWMYEHRLYCYPTKLEKQALSLQTGLSVQKISNWFINSRRRTLPKVLETEGKSANNFTISRKKKNASMAAATMSSSTSLSTPSNDDATSLTDYANHEELKIIDQNSIFYGDGFNVSIGERNGPCYDSVLQEIILPFNENLQPSYEISMANAVNTPQKSEHLYQTMPRAQQASELKSAAAASLYACRGILYDQSTKSKCIYIIVDSPC